MEPTPVAPAAPAKKSSAPMIIAIIIAAILSLCCCLPGIAVLLGFGTYSTTGVIGENGGSIPTMYGLICIGAAIIPWIIPLVVIVVRRQKK
jgi:hypothetical protein